MYPNPSVSAAILLNHYSFDLGDFKREQIVQHWLGIYPPKWILAAVVEAIYQGRYKAISVDRILSYWRVRGQRRSNFDLEFADLICKTLLQDRRARQRSQKIRRMRHVSAA